MCVGKQQQCGANGFSSSRYTKLLWPQTGAAQTLLFDIWNFFPSPSVLFLFHLLISSPPLPLCCWGFFFYDWGLSHSLQAHRRKSVSRLNIDICFLLLVPVLALHILPHMIWCRWLDRTLTSHPPYPRRRGSTGVCTHWVIIIMGAVTTNLNHMLETLCLIKPPDCCGCERAGLADITAHMLLLWRRQNVDIWLVSAEGLTSLRKWPVSHLVQSFLLLL